MLVWKFALAVQLLIFSSVTYAQLPTCKTYGTQAEEVAADKKSGLIVFFDQSIGNEGVFQVWDLNAKKKIKVGKLPHEHYRILGFVNSKTIAFAKFYNPNKDQNTFIPTYYDIESDKIEEVPADAAGIHISAYSLAANIAVGFDRDSGKYSINLKTGEISRIPPLTAGWSHFQSGFSKDGLSFYTVTQANKEYYTTRLAVSKWTGPLFFDSEPKVLTYVEPEDVGLKDSNEYMSSGDRAVSESGDSLALTLSKRAVSGRKDYQKLMWLDLKTNQKTFCDVEHEGVPNVQIVNEQSKIILLQSDASSYHFRRLVNMKTCEMYSLPKMSNVKEVRSGQFIPMSNRNLYYNMGGVWDLTTGESIIRTCE